MPAVSPERPMSVGRDWPSFVQRRYVVLALCVLALAAFNLFFRLDREFVTEWDESLYANTALEISRGGDWIATTLHGQLDYYNTKPPLNVWLIALAFKAFGTNLFALRLSSALAGLITVVIVQMWTRRVLGAAESLLASGLLATSFGFLHAHSARSATTDALFTMLIAATAVAQWRSFEKPWARAALGPLLAAAFLLRGMAVLMPLAIILLVEVLRRVPRPGSIHWPSTIVAAALFLGPVVAWIIARWRIDQWAFLSPLFTYDFVARSLTVIEQHPGSPFFYVTVFQRYQFDWLLLAAVALVVAWRLRRHGATESPARARITSAFPLVLGVWLVVAFVVPTVMRTKLHWYLDPFYPAAAIGLAWLLGRGWKKPVVAALVVVTLAGAEARVLWYSFHNRDLATSGQGLLLDEKESLAGRRIYFETAHHSDVFVVDALVGADHLIAPSVEDFLQESLSGDYFLTSSDVSCEGLRLVRSNGRDWLFERQE